MKKHAITLLLSLACLIGLPSCASCPAAAPDKACAAEPKFDNSYFYDAQGNFQKEKAKDAVIAMLRRHNFPDYENLRDRIWVNDYGKKDFEHLGLSGIGIGNNKEDNYMLCYLFLLPGQMLAEHYHAKSEDGGKAKKEAWFINCGLSYIGGVGADNMKDFPQIKIPASHANGKTFTKHVTPLKAGAYAQLGSELDYHWQYGGPDGAVIIEVGTFQNGKLNRMAFDSAELKK